MTGVRTFFTVIGIILLIGGLLFALLTLGVFQETSLLGYNFDHLVYDYIYTALGFLIAVVGLLLIVLIISRRGSAKGESPKLKGGSVASYTELGEVRTSFKAVETMVLAAARKVSNISEVSTSIESSEQGLRIYITLNVLPEVPIPALAEKLQNSVRDYVQEISGSNVSQVSVLVENIGQGKFQKNTR